MSGLPLFQLLRPYALQAPSANAAIYGRFYSVACITRSPKHHAPHRQCNTGSRRTYAYAARNAEKRILKEAAKAAEENSRATKSRVQKLRELDALHWPRIENPGGVPSMSIPVFKHTYKDMENDSTVKEVLLRGRVLSVRKQSSKLVFIDLQGDFHRVQVMLNFGHLESTSETTIEQYKNKLYTLLRGDFISVVGTAILAGNGELTLRANTLPILLSPSLAPIPTSLTNEETIAHNRPLDLLVNRQAADLLRFRSEVIWWMRSFFIKRRFLEVQTPVLGGYAGGASARPFLTSATEFPHKELALRIAPELWLKRLVIGGFDRVFEIGPCFRNEGLDGTHNPEFTMCEFYLAYASLPDLIELTTELVCNLAKYSSENINQRSTPLESPEPLDFEADFEQIEFIPALEKALGFQLPNLSEADALERLGKILATEIGHQVQPGVSLNKLLDNLAALHIEPASESKPIYIINHPACMSPLAKSFTCPKTGQLISARAELFIKGREIANMYEEENDPFEQRRKFELQVQQRNAGDPDSDEGQALVDESYIQALEHGLPPTGGWGCGVDRLVMLLSGATKISDTLSFGNLRNVVNSTHDLKRM
jgi:lysyl-tRNA synthetase class 2